MQLTIIETFLLWWASWGWIISLLITWAVIVIISHLIARYLRRKAIEGDNPGAFNSIIVIIRLLFLGFGILAILIFIPAEITSQIMILLGGGGFILGAVIGVVSGGVLNNIIAGMYIIITRPFRMKDYIRIGDEEGIVITINLTYTRLFTIDGAVVSIPNQSVQTSTFTNFRIETEKLKSRQDEGMDEKQERVMKQVIEKLDVPFVTRYFFIMSFHLTYQDFIEKAFKTVTKKWTHKFGFEPMFELSETKFRELDYTFTIFTPDPMNVIRHKAGFMLDINKAVDQAATAAGT